MAKFIPTILAAAMMAAMLHSPSAYAGEPRMVGSYGKWDAYVFFENGQKVCYMASQPGLQEGNYSRRGEPFALVTHRPSERTRDVFSYIAGYPYKAGSQATATIDGQEIVLYTQDETAWGADAETDRRLAQAIRDGSKLVITGTSSRGTNTTDTLSLDGSNAAYEKISQECR